MTHPMFARGTRTNQAYRKLSVENHPDRAKDEDERKVMHEKMVELNKAFEVLGDAEKRQMYDAYGEEGPKQQVAHHNANFEYVSTLDNLPNAV